MNTRRRRSSPISSSSAALKSGTAISCCAWSSRPSSSCLRSSRLLRRNMSIARFFAAAMSQAPGLSGMPDSGHCWSAATRASCASSSARPTSRTIRVRPAMILADSILQTASMARWVSVDVTATHHIIFNSPAQYRSGRDSFLAVIGALLCPGRAVLRTVHLANLGLAFPSRPVLLVKFHEALRPFDRFLFRLQLKLRIPADNLFGLGEGPVDHGDLPPGKPDAGALSSREESPVADHRAGFDRLFAELPNGVH